MALDHQFQTGEVEVFMFFLFFFTTIPQRSTASSTTCCPLSCSLAPLQLPRVQLLLRPLSLSMIQRRFALRQISGRCFVILDYMTSTIVTLFLSCFARETLIIGKFRRIIRAFQKFKYISNQLMHGTNSI